MDTKHFALVAAFLVAAPFTAAWATPAFENDSAEAEFTATVSQDELDQSRGEGLGDVTITTVTSTTTATLENNTNSGNSGNNTIDNGALNGAQGIVTVIQNSGHNVIVQSATTTNITTY